MNELAVRQENSVVISDSTKKLIKRSVSKNTLAAYGRALTKLDTWLSTIWIDPRGLNGELAKYIAQLHESGEPLELNDWLLAEYITHLHESGKSPATIAQVVAAVKWRATNANQQVAGAITTRTLNGIRRDGRDRGRGQVDGLTREGMIQVVSYAEASDTLAGLRDSAMIRLMSDCLLRISEVVAVNIEDVKSTLAIHSSKTDQEGKGESLYIGDPTRKVIKQYCAAAEIKTGVLFRRIRRGGHITPERLSVVSARRIIKKRAKDAGIEGFISGHSLRVGTAVSLAQAGATLVDMQTAGRWQDPSMPAHYAKAELAERGAVARFFYGK